MIFLISWMRVSARPLRLDGSLVAAESPSQRGGQRRGRRERERRRKGHQRTFLPKACMLFREISQRLYQATLSTPMRLLFEMDVLLRYFKAAACFGIRAVCTTSFLACGEINECCPVKLMPEGGPVEREGVQAACTTPLSCMKR